MREQSNEYEITIIIKDYRIQRQKKHCLPDFWSTLEVPRSFQREEKQDQTLKGE